MKMSVNAIDALIYHVIFSVQTFELNKTHIYHFLVFGLAHKQVNSNKNNNTHYYLIKKYDTKMRYDNYDFKNEKKFSLCSFVGAVLLFFYFDLVFSSSFSVVSFLLFQNTIINNYMLTNMKICRIIYLNYKMMEHLDTRDFSCFFHFKKL